MNKYIFLAPEIALFNKDYFDKYKSLSLLFTTEKNYIENIKGIEYINDMSKKGQNISFTALFNIDQVKTMTQLSTTYKNMRLFFYYGDYILDEQNKEKTTAIAYCYIKKVYLDNNNSLFYNVELDVVRNVEQVRQEKVKNFFNVPTRQTTALENMNTLTINSSPPKIKKNIILHTNNEIQEQEIYTQQRITKLETTSTQSPSLINSKYIIFCYVLEDFNSLKVDYLENENQDFYIFKTKGDNIERYYNILLQLARLQKLKRHQNQGIKTLLYNPLLNDAVILEKEPRKIKKHIFNNILDTQEQGVERVVICSIIVNSQSPKSYNSIKGFRSFNNLEVRGD